MGLYGYEMSLMVVDASGVDPTTLTPRNPVMVGTTPLCDSKSL